MMAEEQLGSQWSS